MIAKRWRRKTLGRLGHAGRWRHHDHAAPRAPIPFESEGVAARRCIPEGNHESCSLLQEWWRVHLVGQGHKRSSPLIHLERVEVHLVNEPVGRDELEIVTGANHDGVRLGTFVGTGSERHRVDSVGLREPELVDQLRIRTQRRVDRLAPRACHEQESDDAPTPRSQPPTPYVVVLEPHEAQKCQPGSSSDPQEPHRFIF